MAHFAELDKDGVVLRVIVVRDEDCMNEGIESEEVGVAFCTSLLGGRWIQTSYNNRIRKNFAGVGYIYDQDRDAFIPAKPFPSWTLEEQKCYWIPPTPRPEQGFWRWNEESLSWEEIDLSAIPSVTE